jgi:hypothetical protein
MDIVSVWLWKIWCFSQFDRVLKDEYDNRRVKGIIKGPQTQTDCLIISLVFIVILIVIEVIFTYRIPLLDVSLSFLIAVEIVHQWYVHTTFGDFHGCFLTLCKQKITKRDSISTYLVLFNWWKIPDVFWVLPWYSPLITYVSFDY